MYQCLGEDPDVLLWSRRKLDQMHEKIRVLINSRRFDDFVIHMSVVVDCYNKAMALRGSDSSNDSDEEEGKEEYDHTKVINITSKLLSNHFEITFNKVDNQESAVCQHTRGGAGDIPQPADDTLCLFDVRRAAACVCLTAVSLRP